MHIPFPFREAATCIRAATLDLAAWPVSCLWAGTLCLQGLCMRARSLFLALCCLLACVNVVTAAPSRRDVEGTGAGSLARAGQGCTFVLGFARLRDLLGADTVGACLSNQFATDDGARQPTTRGVLTWRQADNWTGFTDGRF